jgi:hypothetical protein
VHDDAGKPVKGVRVTLSNPMRMGPRGLGEGMPRPGITDDQGRFVLRNAPRGKRTIECFHPHFLRKADQVQIGEEPRHDAGTIVLERGMKITGVVVDTDGQPVVDAQVTASKRQRDRTGVQRAFGGLNDQTDAAGKFGFYGLEPGEYRLSVSKDGFFVDPAVVAAGTEGHRIAVVAAGELKGFVRAEGKPVAEARISARIEGGSNAWATTGSDGRFTLGQLPPGKPFQLTIRHDRYRNLVREGVVATASEQAFDLEVGRVVEGIVVDENGRPVDGAQIQVHPGWRRASTGKDGRFQVSGFDEVELTVQLTESGRGYIQGEEVKLPVGENSVRLVAVVGKSIKGKVVGPDGKPASLVSIQAIDERGKSVANTWVGDLSGEFELRGVPPGTYTLRLTRWRNDGNDRTTHDVPGVVAGREDVTLEVPE